MPGISIKPLPLRATLSTLVIMLAMASFASVSVKSSTPSSGAVKQVGESASWSAGPFTAASADRGTCVEGANCDGFTLNVQVPAGKVARVNFRIEWASATNDFDLFILDSQGNQLEDSAEGDTNFEQVAVEGLASGTYKVLVNAFAAVNSTYSGRATLEAINDPPALPLMSPEVTFNNNTLVDYSATSGEPIVRVDNQDNIFVTSPFGLSTTLSLLWKSVDGGRSFIPFGTPILRDAVVGPGGGDTHVDFDANNWVYYVDLSGACVTAAVSTDGGNTFAPERTNHIACFSDETPEGAVDDRQWVAGFGNGTGYVTFRNLNGSNFYLFKTTDGGLSWDKGRLIGTVSQSGPLMVDKQKRRVTVNGVEKEAIILYQIYYQGTDLRLIRIIDFADGTALKIDNFRIVNPGQSVSNVFPVLAVDRQGNLYAVWSQSASVIWMATSTTRGESWSAPARVSGLTGTNIMPWIVAGDAGRVDIIWYRSQLTGNPVSALSEWDIYMAQSLNALSAGPTFSLNRVSQNLIHRGEICLRGLNCDIDGGDRSFLEYPSISVDSKGAAVIVFNDNTNQVEGPYVVVSKQTGGPSLYASVGVIKPAPGSATVAQPAAGETIKTVSYTASGAHQIPPKNFDRDESGDARFPDHGPRIGANIPALDIKSVTLKDDADSITVTMQMADLSAAALATAPLQAGGDGVLYLTQWDANDDIYWVAAEFRAGQPRFYTGTLGMIKSATSKKFITYNPDLASSLQVQGQVTNGPGGTVTMKVPRALVGNSSNGSRLHTVTGYAFSERGPLLPVTGGQPNPSSLPVQVDASGAFTYVLGEGPQLDGVVEASLDDATFSAPRPAQLVNIAADGRWQLSLAPSDLRPGAHTLYVRQRINGREVSPVTAISFTASETVEQLINEMVSLQTTNPRFSGGVASYDLSIKNGSSDTIFTPLRAEVVAIAGGATVANADNSQPGAGAFWEYGDRVGGDARLAPGELSGTRSLRFNNPSGAPFSVTFNVIGGIARANAGAFAASSTTSDSDAGKAESGATGVTASQPGGTLTGMLFRVTYNPLLNSVTVELIKP